MCRFFGYDYDSYNYYQDCYQSTYDIPSNRKWQTPVLARRRRPPMEKSYLFDGTSSMGNNAAVKPFLFKNRKYLLRTDDAA